jgi:signal transduction histidine kinase
MSICSAAPRSASVITDEVVEVLSIDAAILYSPGQEDNYKFRYFFYNMFASIMSWKLQTTSERAKLYLESGQLFFSFVPGDICQTIEEEIQKFLPEAEAKGLRLTYQISPFPEPFNFDQARIKEGMGHVLENALQFTEEGEISVRMFHEEGQTVVPVTDSGHGIAEQDYAKVFNKFELIEDMTYHHRGLGLGMPLSRLIMEMHQGRIWVESELNQGSTCTFALPHHLEASSEEGESEGDDDDFSHLL